MFLKIKITNKGIVNVFEFKKFVKKILPLCGRNILARII
jgi:hypothetical protein